MKPLFTRKELRKMAVAAKRGKWTGLIELGEIPDFARWLSRPPNNWMGQAPDTAEVLRMYKDGWTITVGYDGRRTCCGRLCMAMWYAYQCFKEDDEK